MSAVGGDSGSCSWLALRHFARGQYIARDMSAAEVARLADVPTKIERVALGVTDGRGGGRSLGYDVGPLADEDRRDRMTALVREMAARLQNHADTARRVESERTG